MKQTRECYSESELKDGKRKKCTHKVISQTDDILISFEKHDLSSIEIKRMEKSWVSINWNQSWEANDEQRNGKWRNMKWEKKNLFINLSCP